MCLLFALNFAWILKMADSSVKIDFVKTPQNWPDIFETSHSFFLILNFVLCTLFFSYKTVAKKKLLLYYLKSVWCLFLDHLYTPLTFSYCC